MAKVRTQIQLEPEEHRRLRERARRLGLSVSQLVRQAVRRELGLDDTATYTEDEIRAVLDVSGIGREPDERRDIAEHHDDVLYGSER